MEPGMASGGVQHQGIPPLARLDMTATVPACDRRGSELEELKVAKGDVLHVVFRNTPLYQKLHQLVSGLSASASDVRLHWLGVGRAELPLMIRELADCVAARREHELRSIVMVDSPTRAWLKALPAETKKLLPAPVSLAQTSPALGDCFTEAVFEILKIRHYELGQGRRHESLEQALADIRATQATLSFLFNAALVKPFADGEMRTGPVKQIFIDPSHLLHHGGFRSVVMTACMPREAGLGTEADRSLLARATDQSLIELLERSPTQMNENVLEAVRRTWGSRLGPADLNLVCRVLRSPASIVVDALQMAGVDVQAQIMLPGWERNIPILDALELEDALFVLDRHTVNSALDQPTPEAEWLMDHGARVVQLPIENTLDSLLDVHGMVRYRDLLPPSALQGESSEEQELFARKTLRAALARKIDNIVESGRRILYPAA